MAADTSPDTPDIRGWLSQQEAARAYHVTARTIRRRIARGEVRAVPVLTEHGPGWAVEPPPAYTPGAGAGGDVPPVPLDAAGLLALLQQQATTIAQLTSTNAALVEQLRTLQDRPALLPGPVEPTPPALAAGPVTETPIHHHHPRSWWQFWRRAQIGHGVIRRSWGVRLIRGCAVTMRVSCYHEGSTEPARAARRGRAKVGPE